MRKDELKDALSRLDPDDDARERMLIKAMEKHKKRKRGINGVSGVMLKIAVIFLLLCGTAVSIDAATNGSVRRFIGGLFGQNTNTQEVAGQAELAISRDMVFAPDLIHIDAQILIFSTGRGIIVYDRIQDALAQTIDLQETDCIYFNTLGDVPRSHALYEDGILHVFNEKDGERVGRFYRYDLTDGDAIEEAASFEDDALFSDIFSRWKDAQNGRYARTFETFENIGLTKERRHPNDQLVYSEYSYRLDDGNGNEYLCYLTVPTDDQGTPTENRYVLNMYLASKDEALEASLRIGDSSTPDGADTWEEEKLPAFVYTGDDPVERAVCDYILDEYTRHFERDKNIVFIPSPYILTAVERGDSMYVFGKFLIYGYFRNGNTLETSSGGEFPARIEFKKNPDGSYEFIEVVNAPDGADYDVGIRDFTDGFEGVYDMYFGDWSVEEKIHSDIRKSYIRMYEQTAGLGIKYYQDYGWEPVPIDE